MGSVFGRNIRVTLFGQSHAPAVGVVVDGLPAGFAPDMGEMRDFMKRRAPGQTILSTQRQEPDLFEVLGGMADGKLCGAPFAAIIKNRNTRSQDYAGLKDKPRPGHADYPAQVKYQGAQDADGGGHFSARLTAPLCIAGALCIQLLRREGIRVGAHVLQIADVHDTPFDPLAPQLDALIPEYIQVLDANAGAAMASTIDEARMAGDSVGGVVECAVTGLPVGVGEPIFDGVENHLAQAIFGIPAVRGLAFGSGYAAASLRGSSHNDPYTFRDGRVVTRTNNHGGVLGGLTTGMPLVFTVAFKPTSSIFLEQDTVDLVKQQDAKLALKGRHDPCIVPRAVPCVEAAAAIALYDLFLDYKKGGHV